MHAAQYQAARLGYGFSADSLSAVHSFVDGGVNVLQSAGQLSDEPSLALAEANITAFASAMVLEARDQNLPELRESTFHAARARLCPLWPFCR